MGWVSLKDEKIGGEGQETESTVEGSLTQMQNKDRNIMREMTAREDLKNPSDLGECPRDNDG